MQSADARPRRGRQRDGVSLMAVRRFITRHRGSLALAFAVGLAALAISWAHGAPAMHDMDGPMDGTALTPSICLAVLFGISGVGLLAVGGLVRRRRPAMRRGAGVRRLVAIRPPLEPCNARAGPAQLQVFLR